MKTLLRFAVGAAIAGVVVNQVMKMQAERRALRSRGETATDVGPDSSYDANQVADTNTIGSEASQQGQQPQDWRGAQNVLE